MNTQQPIKIASIVTLFVACALGAGVQAQTVKAPPLPPGSHMVKHKPGMSHAEEKRSERAHHHKFHNKKDVTRDDTVHGDPSHDHDHGKPAATPAPAAAPSKKAK